MCVNSQIHNISSRHRKTFPCIVWLYTNREVSRLQFPLEWRLNGYDSMSIYEWSVFTFCGVCSFERIPHTKWLNETIMGIVWTLWVLVLNGRVCFWVLWHISSVWTSSKSVAIKQKTRYTQMFCIQYCWLLRRLYIAFSMITSILLLDF